MATNQRPNVSVPTTDSGSTTDRATKNDRKWVDTISDWDAVLDSSSKHSDRGDSDGAVTTVSSARNELPPGVDTVTRIDPISDELLDATLETLPSEWLADTDTQIVIQKLVYQFVAHTAETDPTHKRFQSVCDEMDCDSFAQLCTAPLYDDRPEMWTEYFETDLEAIENRIRSRRTE